MALNFPTAPSVGTTHNAANGLQYIFDGTKWTSQGTYTTGAINAKKLDNITLTTSVGPYNLTVGSAATIPHNNESLLITVTDSSGDNPVIQQPGTDYTIFTDSSQPNEPQSKIKFGSAPTAGHIMWGVLHSRLPIDTVDKLARAGGTMTGDINFVAGQTFDGRDVSVDGTKLDGIEANATADQTNAEIRAAVEAATDSNVFTDADHTKLNGITASANNYVHPNHSGEVTSTADGAQVVADDVIDEANLKVDNSPTNDYGLTAKSSAARGLTWAEAADGTPEGTAIKSTGESGGSKFLREDGDGTCSWQTVPAGGISDVVSDTSPQLGGNLDVNTKNITFGDSAGATDDRITFGAGTDLSIYHDATHNYIKSTNGNIAIHHPDTDVFVYDTANSRYNARFNNSGHCELWDDGTKRIETTASGATITGDLDPAADSSHDLGSNSVRWANGYFDTLYGDGSNLTNVGGTITALNNATANELVTVGATTTELDAEASLTFQDTTSTGLISGKQITGRGFECPATVSDDWTIAAGNNAFFPGPMTVASGKTVTVPANRTLTVV